MWRVWVRKGGCIGSRWGNRREVELGRPRRRWVDNIRMDLQEVGCGYVDWIGLAQDRDRWRTLVSAVMNLGVPWDAGNFLTSCKPVSFSRRTLDCGVSKQYSADPPSGPDPPRYRGFTIILRHIALGKTPLDEWSARLRDLYLTTHNTHNRHPSMPPVGFEPHDLSRRAATNPRFRPRGHWYRSIGLKMITKYKRYKKNETLFMVRYSERSFSCPQRGWHYAVPKRLRLPVNTA